MKRVNKETFDSVIDFTTTIYERKGEETYFFSRKDKTFLGLISREELKTEKRINYFLA